MIAVHVSDEQSHVQIDPESIAAAVRAVAGDAGYREGEISIALVDDQRIARLHGEYLGEVTPTDTMSWVLEADGARIEGEVVASAETAVRRGPEFDQPAERELLLYVIHGTLHLVGCDDQTAEARETMRRREQYYLDRCAVSES